MNLGQFRTIYKTLMMDRYTRADDVDYTRELIEESLNTETDYEICIE